MEKLFLVDVSAMFFRAYYAIRPLSNSAGLPTNALFGFLNMTTKLLNEFKPHYIAYCFDRKEKSFRSEMYDLYKANRSEMPEDLVPQVPYLAKITDALGIPRFDLEGYEADDIIGMLTKFGEKQKLEVIIVSGDKDFAQFVSSNVKMYDPMKDTWFDPQGVQEKWGVKPEQIIDYLSLVGDSSDNIPGVKGVGPKGAQKLLGEFSSLESLYENLDKVKNEKLKQKLIDSKESAFLSKDLVTIVTENKISVATLDDIAKKPIVTEELKNILLELEFKNFSKKLLSQNTESPQEAPKTTGEFKAGFQIAFSDFVCSENFTVQEVDSKELQKLLHKSKNTWVIRLNNYWGFLQDSILFKIEKEEENLLSVLESLNLKFKGHDLKSFYREIGFTAAPESAWDSMLAAYVLKPGNIGDFSNLVQAYYPVDTPDLTNDLNVLQAHIHIEKNLEALLKENSGRKIYEEIEMPLLPILWRMERSGIELDVEVLQKQQKVVEEELVELKKKVFAATKEEFNLDSPKQLGEVLFEKMKLPVIKKTKTGYSTNSEVLEKLSKTHEFCNFIIEYRELKKLLSTYIEALPKLVEPDGRLHTHLNQAITATGRLSSTNPNLQNIPIRTTRGNDIRNAFVSENGKLLVSADYSQIELRILAHITQDPGLVKAFSEDLDIHTATASEVFGVKLAEVDADMRRKAKAVNFGIAYGMGAYSLAENLGISRAESKEIIDTYFTRFKNVKAYMNDIVKKANVDGYVESIFGRRRYIPELKSKNKQIQNFGERIAINSPVQGSSSDLVKMAMLKVSQEVPNANMLLQVHDELIFEVFESDHKSISEQVKKSMEDVYKLSVPLKVNVASAKSWKDAH